MYDDNVQLLKSVEADVEKRLLDALVGETGISLILYLSFTNFVFPINKKSRLNFG